MRLIRLFGIPASLSAFLRAFKSRRARTLSIMLRCNLIVCPLLVVNEFLAFRPFVEVFRTFDAKLRPVDFFFTISFVLPVPSKNLLVDKTVLV